MTVVTEMDNTTDEKQPPENRLLYRKSVFESALQQIAGTEWPVNVFGVSPQKIAREALGE
jgi:hypothetical protein